MFFVILLFAFFEGSSVATSMRAEAIFTNPAGLGIRRGFEFYFSKGYTKEGFANDFKASLLLSNSAVAYDDSDSSFTYGWGMIFGSRVSLGISYNSKRDEVKGGFILRPNSFISFGGVVTNIKKENSYRTGIALRPFTKAITFIGEVIFKDTLEDYRYGIALTPIEGLNIYASGGKNGKLNFGIDLSLGRVRTGSNYNMDDERGVVDVVLSKDEYPVLYKERKVAEVIVSGKYSDEKFTFLIYRRKNFGELMFSLNKLSRMDDVKAILLKLEYNDLGPGRAEELVREIEKLKSEGKKIYVYSDNYSIINYYIASSGDKVYLHPIGSVIFPGIYLGKIYFKGTLDKLGIQAQVARVGKYKSAVEPLIRKDMSAEDSIQMARILDVVFEELVERVSTGRNIPKDSLLTLIDSLGFFNADKCIEFGFVDSLITYEELKKFVKKEERAKVLGINKIVRKRVNFDFALRKPKIAVLVAEGSIVEGKSGYNPFPIFGGKYVGDETIKKLCKMLEKDRGVKAVVLRVNSPGGSAFASEEILMALRELNKKKPVIVSMGNLAASGGYYISSIGGPILADKTTITGSIGVLGAKFVMRGFYEKLGFSADYVKRGKHSDAFSTWRPFDEEEKLLFQKEIEWFYDKFLRRVSEARGLSKDSVHTIAQGRVWMGVDARKIGLVDRIGGLLDAIELAKDRVGIKGEAEVVFVREKKKFPFSLLGTSTLNIGTPPLLNEEGPLFVFPYSLKIN